MFDTDTFLTTLYVTVDDFCKHYLPPEPRRRGPEATLSRSELITLALFGQWSRFASERDFWRFAKQQLVPLFPTLPHRSQFSRLQRLYQADISAFGGDAYRFCQHFIETEHVAFTPGVDFGRYQADHHVRFAYTQNLERLEQAVERIARGLKSWRP